jgi:hypothetical protein
MKLANLLPPLVSLNSRTDYVGFVVDQMALEQFFCDYFDLHFQYKFTKPVYTLIHLDVLISLTIDNIVK